MKFGFMAVSRGPRIFDPEGWLHGEAKAERGDDHARWDGGDKMTIEQLRTEGDSGPTVPGWHPDPGGAPAWRWWDGSRWSSFVDRDPRVGPGRTTPSGGTYRWLAPPGWPEPHRAWYPEAAWRPGVAWPPPDRSWQWWDFDGEEPIGSDTAHSRLGEIYAIEEDSSAWGAIDYSTVPLVWCSPPSWPAPPRGWSPPSGWRSPRSWGRAPKDWQFWQPDPMVVDERQRVAVAGIYARSLLIASTPLGILSELDRVEDISAMIGWVTPLAESPLPVVAQLGWAPPSDDPSRLALRSASQDGAVAASSLRTYLLQCGYGLVDRADHAGALRARLYSALVAYSSAVQGVLEAEVQHFCRKAEGELARLRARAGSGRLTSRDRARVNELLWATAALERELEQRVRNVVEHRPSRIASSALAVSITVTLTQSITVELGSYR